MPPASVVRAHHKYRHCVGAVLRLVNLDEAAAEVKLRGLLQQLAVVGRKLLPGRKHARCGRRWGGRRRRGMAGWRRARSRRRAAASHTAASRAIAAAAAMQSRAMAIEAAVWQKAGLAWRWHTIQ